MAKGAIINTVGIDLENYRKDIVKKVKDLIVDKTTKVELLANRDLIANSTVEFNLNFISVDKRFLDGGFTGEVGVMGYNEMAAYIEFGTGLSAKEILSKYPKWIQDIAYQFYVNGMGTLQGKPYLYNNFLIVWAEFVWELGKILKKKYKS